MYGGTEVVVCNCHTILAVKKILEWDNFLKNAGLYTLTTKYKSIIGLSNHSEWDKFFFTKRMR